MGAGVLVASRVGSVSGDGVPVCDAAVGAGVGTEPASVGEVVTPPVPVWIVGGTSAGGVGLADGGAAGGATVGDAVMGALIGVSTAPQPATSAAAMKATAVASSRVLVNGCRWPSAGVRTPRAV